MQSESRNLNWDALKGIMILVLSFNHLAVWFPTFRPAGQYSVRPIGYFTMLEGFIFLASLTLAASATRSTSNSSFRRSVGRRIRRAYAAYVFILAFVLTLAQYVPLQDNEILPRYFAAPVETTFELLTLRCKRFVLSILPLHIVLIGLAFFLVPLVRQKNTAHYAVFASIATWVGAWFYTPSFLTVMGFNPLSWQILTVIGLAVSFHPTFLRRYSRIVIPGACAVLIVAAAMRFEFIGRFESLRPHLFARRNLPVGALISFLAFAVVVSSASELRYGSWPVVRVIGAWCGRHTLAIFTTNVCIAFLCNGLSAHIQRLNVTTEIAVFVACYVGALAPVALLRRFK